VVEIFFPSPLDGTFVVGVEAETRPGVTSDAAAHVAVGTSTGGCRLGKEEVQ